MTRERSQIKPKPATTDPPSRVFDAVQQRMDTWNGLENQATWLYEFSRSSRDQDMPRAAVAASLETLAGLETYWAFPGASIIGDLKRILERREYDVLARRVAAIVRLLLGDMYRTRPGSPGLWLEDGRSAADRGEQSDRANTKPYFEVLIVDPVDVEEQRELRQQLVATHRDEDEFLYDTVFVPTFEDAVIAILFNRTIQSCIIRDHFGYHTSATEPSFERYLDFLDQDDPTACYGLARSLKLGRTIKRLRPEVDLFLVTDTPMGDVAGHLGRDFRRAFYRFDQFLELHLSILKGIRARYETPFFDALRRYSKRPTGVFHALPVARAKSITQGHWIRDMAQFYGVNIFLAETSATSGGLDSLLEPHGPIKRAQELAARAFGAMQSFFVTNGTSTANKIVVQALVRPGDIVLASHDCHKSHHYALMLAGAYPVYLDPYPLPTYTIYGGVPLAVIKSQLHALRRAGKLDRVRMLLLTNCTFDGITYDPERVMREVLAIKPDMIFVWDEAWFAFAAFDPVLRQRTAMDAANRLRRMYRSPEYRSAYEQWRAEAGDRDPPDDETAVDGPAPLADPDRVRIRVYATQSTHKTLTALRQGSMIHVYDEAFEQQVRDVFQEAFMTHTSTSPNYQIIASLDIGRRQVELEGYEMVQKSIGLAMAMRERIYDHPVLKRYFSVLRPADLIPEEYRPSGLEFYYDPKLGWARMEEAWRTDEFTLDPTRVTVHVGRTGLDGDTFRHLLMDEHDIQINKTSRNTALFMTHIGTSRGDIAYLVEVLASITQDIDDELSVDSVIDQRMHRQRVTSLTEQLPALPNFSRFHASFKPDPAGDTPEGDMRRAYFGAYDDEACEYMKLGSLRKVLGEGREVVSATFVTPYPPGFPVLVPGQVIDQTILEYLRAVDVKEIHGYKREYGLRVFTEAALSQAGADKSSAHLAVTQGD